MFITFHRMPKYNNRNYLIILLHRKKMAKVKNGQN